MRELVTPALRDPHVDLTVSKSGQVATQIEWLFAPRGEPLLPFKDRIREVRDRRFEMSASSTTGGMGIASAVVDPTPLGVLSIGLQASRCDPEKERKMVEILRTQATIRQIFRLLRNLHLVPKAGLIALACRSPRPLKNGGKSLRLLLGVR